ncbi:hypothetical protein LJR084_007278 [Variovorax sp. LjRoot84]|uniref:hypothetical protein n=1 Tax=Variovorax sp. LjRoot84 TaxID=3342340 RepID=UPI003ECD353A
MKSITRLLLAERKLTGLGVALLFLIGVLVLFGSVAFLPMVWMRWTGASMGLGCMAVAGYSGQAYALGLPPPFTNDPLGWRKAKATYKDQPIPEDHSSDKPEPEQRERERE